MFYTRKAKFSATGIRTEKKLLSLLDELKKMFESKAIRTVIDRQCTLEQTAKAHRYINEGHKKGNVVISGMR